VEAVGISTKNYSDEARNALNSIEKKVHWFEGINQRGNVTLENEIEFQVVIKVDLN
jgi:flavin-binding protein dodecin